MTTPTTSIITPVHNSAAFLDACIDSVQAQTREDWELILVDDASSDDSRKRMAARAEDDARIRPIYLSQNQGAAVARNTAIEKARGRYIAFLDSDDLWAPDKLERQLALCEAQGAAFVYGAYTLRKENSAPSREKTITPQARIHYRGLLNATIIATSTALYDREAFGGRVYMPEIRKRQDLGLWLKLLRRTDWAHGVVDSPVATICKRPGSLSDNKFSALYNTWRLYRDHEGLSASASLWHLANYATRAAFKYLG
ncbi:glycosyltransferase involved in cell wall biosynthesis [Natronospira proteinivora]|uniref:Glycosyltransferase involved in cell wall biosynthesis n=1 Tax=Natronospira proteinivora TaxID=1807133 RepID=A0ABT1G9D7_9GAMM|nr:glycosyltransferase family 2 protein [Natronospira proteinivora]MCP1727914.1 glycosyltransferase involved in cell wall biosynthesis [Natronospira proteinivora]